MRILYFLLVIFSLTEKLVFAIDYYQVNRNQVNVRVDSRTSAESLGLLEGNDLVEVTDKKFGWYRIVLPPSFPCYIFKKFTEPIDAEKVKVTAKKVNLRSGPSLTDPIIGQAPYAGIFKVIDDSGDWLKIENSAYAKGWVHKDFLKKRPSTQELIDLVNEVMPKLSTNQIKEKAILHQKLIDGGVEIVPLLQARLLTSDAPTTYSLIIVLSKLAETDPNLTRQLIQRARQSSLREASIYLDVLQNIIQLQENKIPFFYRFQQGSLSEKDLTKYLALLEKVTQ